MQPPVYKGITGFKTREQVAHVLAHMSQDPFRQLMVGVLASQRTIMLGQFKPDGRSPKCEDIASIFPPGDTTLNLVHYYTEDQRHLDAQIEQALFYGGSYCHGIQLNIAWPDPFAMEDVRFKHPNLVMVVQLGGRLWSLLDYMPEALAHRVLDWYDGAADYVLVDTSGGLGKEMNVNVLTAYIEALDAHLSVARCPIRLAVAGGLCADNLEMIWPLCDQFHRLSFDAEGKLHSGPGQLDLDACLRYLDKATELPG